MNDVRLDNIWWMTNQKGGEEEDNKSDEEGHRSTIYRSQKSPSMPCGFMRAWPVHVHVARTRGPCAHGPCEHANEILPSFCPSPLYRLRVLPDS